MSQIDPQQFLDALPHCKALSMRIDSMEDGKVHLSMPYDPRLIGDPATGVMHGGAVYALLDTASGIAVQTHPESGGSTATLDLRVDYMRPATPGQRVRAVAHIYHMTRTVAFIRATAFDDDETRPVASATGAFTNEGKSVGAKP